MKWIFPDQKDLNLIDWLYKSRNIDNRTSFLSPKYEELHSPFLIHDMQKAVEAISENIKLGKKIFIHGDFDVDGISATSLLWQFLFREAKANVMPYIPSRFTEGYGLSEESINTIIKAGGELIITVDCGVKDIELVHKYSNQIKFIITDHHTILDNLPENLKEGAKPVSKYLISSDALAVVHPRLNEYPFKELCGAAVAWKLCSALNEHMGLNIDMIKYIDLAALGTVCDVMPLVEENRIIAKLGIEQMKKTINVGLDVMFEILAIDKAKLDSYHLGFVIGPRLNASGRLESAMDAVRLLTTKDRAYAASVVKKLNELNSERQQLTQKYIEIAEEQIMGQKENKLFLVYGEDWPEGIIGLIAGKLTEKYNRPVIAASLKEGKLKASARSIDPFHIAESLSNAKELLLTHGGHAQAAGFSLKYENLDKLKEHLLTAADNKISNNLEKSLYIDGVINCGKISPDIIREIMQFAPFGMGNKKPVVALMNLNLKNYRTLGKENNHIKFIAGDSDSEIECIAFNFSDKFNDFLGTYSTPSLINVAGSLDIDSWNGNEKSVLKVEDLQVAK